MNLKSLMVAGVSLVALMVQAAVNVTNVKVQQRYPWNGKVDIDYTVTCDDADADIWVYPMGYDQDSNASMACRALEGDGVGAPVKAGAHRMTWDVSADYPNFNSTAFTVKMTALTGGAPYLVVDLSGGVDAQTYPVSYLSSIPAGGWSDEYKTTKLVLRLIPPGTFMMGSPTDELGHDWYSSNYETLHQVTLTQPFYIGVFEVTQKQYQLVMDSAPSSHKGDARPVDSVRYDWIRGWVNGAAWPKHNQVDADSFMGRLRSKVNLLFDLPTEAQWEYACRAGTSTALNSGKNLTATGSCANMHEVGRYYYNNRDGKGGYNDYHTTVGSYLPNAWGLYDMHGNVGEWCLDWWQNDLGANAVTNPKGPNSGSYRLVRGGASYWSSGSSFNYAAACRSAYRTRYYNGNTYSYMTAEYVGFRAVCLPAE